MTKLPLNTLRAFSVVGELQNLRAAAQALHLTHSAVSQQIRVLETSLGFEVFDRRGRGVVLNAAGETLLVHVQCALQQLDDGVRIAADVAKSQAQRVRVSVLPSFAQRWLLPRISRWHSLHPEITLEFDASMRVVDLQREGFHAALRQGVGPWPGVTSVRLFDAPMPLYVVGCAVDAKRLVGQPASALLREPLLGDRDVWQRWFAAAGVQAEVTPVAYFNDNGLMLQAAEHGLGLALAREVLAADALRAGKLIRLSDVSVEHDSAHTYHLVYPPALQDWPPMVALQAWLRDEIARSQELVRVG